MTSVDHGEGGDWVDRWNNLVDFRFQSALPPSVTWEGGTVLSVLSSPWRQKGSTNYISVSNPHFFTDACPEFVNSIRPKLRSRFVPTPDCSIDEIDVAIHLRLYQPKDVQFTSSRLSNLSEVISKLNLLPVMKTVTVFVSPNALDSLSDLPKGFEVSSEDALVSITRMSQAKTLVIGRSSMSYLAGLVSSGEVWCPKFWHPPMADWKKL
jgi:hypothetical protein